MAKTKGSSKLSICLIKSCKIVDSLIIDLLLNKLNMDTFILKLEDKNRQLQNKVENEMRFDRKLNEVYQCYMQHCSNLKYYNETHLL